LFAPRCSCLSFDFLRHGHCLSDSWPVVIGVHGQERWPST
jgi:hypothetical protein